MDKVVVGGTIFDVPAWSDIHEFESGIGSGELENPLSWLVSCELYAPYLSQEWGTANGSELDVYALTFKVPYGVGADLCGDIFHPVRVDSLVDGQFPDFLIDGEGLPTAEKIDFVLEDDGVRVSFFADGLIDFIPLTVFASRSDSFVDDVKACIGGGDFIYDLGHNLQLWKEKFELGMVPQEMFRGDHYSVVVDF